MLGSERQTIYIFAAKLFKTLRLNGGREEIKTSLLLFLCRNKHLSVPWRLFDASSCDCAEIPGNKPTVD